MTGSAVLGEKPRWIWSSAEAQSNQTAYFHKSFQLKRETKSATLSMSCDNAFEAWVNGKKVLSSGSWETGVKADVSKHLVQGVNVIAVSGRNDGGPAGLVGVLEVMPLTSRVRLIATDATWKVSEQAEKGWNKPGFKANSWKRAHAGGTLGVSPWGQVFAKARVGKASVAGVPLPEDLQLAAGFKAELLHIVPKNEQGSWVSLTNGPRGRLIASDQYGYLYRITPPKLGGNAEETKVEKLEVDIGHAHGMLWAFDSLYVVVNGKGINGRGSGLYRVRDTDGDDQFDQVELLKALEGSGEHGPHTAILTPDKKNLLIIAGNHTRLPKGLDGMRNPSPTEEDLLLPRQPDARGHARTIRAPGGWICQTDPDGKRWELVSSGYRNAYDIALDAEGELFTYDADMEWDYGTPWYRPTRVNHAISGSEFGWRTGTGKWPTHYPDSLPATVDIGPGCPTGVVFGTGAKFPKKYQQALYILDWTFGTIYAVHMKANGSSYIGQNETFVASKPLPVTDIVVGHDGAMYFTIGGRRTQSALYRITWNGPKAAAEAPATDSSATKLRKLRRSLENFHGRRAKGAVEAAWQHLNHRDRFIRFAARVAIENQPVAEWRDRVFRESSQQAILTATVALARMGDHKDASRLLEKLVALNFKALSPAQQLELTRAYSLVFIRMGEPNRELAGRITAELDAAYPAKDPSLNRELCQLLVFLKSPSVVPKTLALMDRKVESSMVVDHDALNRNDGYGGTIKQVLANTPEMQNLHYAMTLRNLRYGWTPGQRQKYFNWFKDAATKSGGVSYAGFLKNFQKDALANAPAAERPALEKLTGDASLAFKPVPLPKPKGPGQNWTHDKATNLVVSGLSRRNFDNGQKMFAAAQCATCHRFNGGGGTSGPDLSSVANRFSNRDLLESIIDPNKEVSDQYEASLVTREDGTVLPGRILFEEDGKLHLSVNPLDPDHVIVVDQSEVKSIKPSPVSPMPPGLINALNKDELLDLIAYLVSGGNKAHSVFR